MKRAIILVIALAVALSCVISGTTAFFTDSVTARGVIKSGNIDVAQIEKMRGSEGLTKYSQNRPLYPAVYDGVLHDKENKLAQGMKYDGVVESAKDKDKTTKHEFMIWDASKVSGAHDKMVFVENVGSNPFYFRTVYALEADVNGGIEHIELNRNTTDYIWDDNLGVAEINGKKYVMISATYNWEVGENGSSKYADAIPGTLPAGQISEPSLIQVAMDKAAQNDYVKHFGDEYEILVVTQAIQTTTMVEEYEALSNDAKKNYSCISDYALSNEDSFGKISASNHPFAALVETK